VNVVIVVVSSFIFTPWLTIIYALTCPCCLFHYVYFWYNTVHLYAIYGYDVTKKKKKKNLVCVPCCTLR
jgi:hypothetical protein